MVLMVLGMVSEIELSFIKQRQSEGIAAAKARGSLPRQTPVGRLYAILQLQALGVTAIAAKMYCCRGTVYKALGEILEQN